MSLEAFIPLLNHLPELNTILPQNMAVRRIVLKADPPVQLALPMRHAGVGYPATPLRGYGAEGSEGALVAPPGFCKADELEDTGDPFRSSDLGVMSPARLPLRHAGEGCCECECECVLLAFCVA